MQHHLKTVKDVSKIWAFKKTKQNKTPIRSMRRKATQSQHIQRPILHYFCFACLCTGFIVKVQISVQSTFKHHL